MSELKHLKKEWKDVFFLHTEETHHPFILTNTLNFDFHILDKDHGF